MIKTLSEALAERGYDTLTEVQLAVSDPELSGADLLVSAQTGSGKTVGFGLAIAPTLMGEAERLGPAGAPLALVVAPTRELAFQVMRELGWLYAKAGARVVSCVGGMDMRDERRALERGAHIVVGTPGRLRDHIERRSLDMTGLRAVVLDEADEMLDLGFREDLEFMLGAAPEDRRTLLFSATVPPLIAKLAQQFQRDAVRVTTLTGAGQHADIAYQAVEVAVNDEEHAIINLLRYHEAQNALVFAKTRAAVNHLTARLANRGFSVVSLSGELSQSERTHALQAMRDGRARVCVATDVAARGIDLPMLELVIHADLPTNPEVLLHRSGRTGRAGRKGISALVVTPRSAKRAERLMKLAKVRADWVSAPGADEILRRDEERLLEDPAWDEPVTEAQAEFAARLLETRSPEQIAAAYLRLYRARQSAPEELAPPGEKAAPKERKPFGPSVWLSLSVGHADRAEARWLLPLLCRVGDLQKDTIGAIRVQDDETFVELAVAGSEAFLARLDDNGELEDGITAHRLDGAPDLAPGRKPAARKPVGHRGTRRDEAPAERAAVQEAAPASAERAEAPRVEAPRADKPREDRPRGDKPDWKKPRADKPRGDKPDWKKPRADKPREDRPRDDKPEWKKPRADKPREDRPREDKPDWKKPRGDKPGGYKGRDDKPGGGKPRGDKPDWKKPRGDKPAGAKPAGKPSTLRPGALDTSQRMVRPGDAKRGGPKTGGAKPGKGKPGAGKPRAGHGAEPPRRKG